jgi:phosphoribosylaminoimidazole-succinocarboxamide synthase
VREVFDLGTTLLVVATDRISAFDVILPTGIPDKGRVLTQLSRFWFEQTADVVPSHFLSVDDGVIADAIRGAGGVTPPAILHQLSGRAMLVNKAQALPVECVARGYISGSLWKEYKTLFPHGGTITLHGVTLPVGLRESDRLPEPVFTPATKAQEGHDENVSFEMAAQSLGNAIAEQVRDLTLKLYTSASDYARERGIIIADTKFEFGLLDGQVILIDEALTPDSSRFWDAAAYAPGRAQASFDKQFVRDYLETLDWDKTDPGPELPPDVVEKTSAKYRDAYERLMGSPLPEG